MTDTPALGTFEAKGQVAHPDESGLRSTLIGLIRTAADEDPRSLQKTVGPSEIGTPCLRQLGYKLARTPASRSVNHDPWPSILGKAAHEWLAKYAMALDNAKRAAPPRWLIEHEVQVAPGLKGSSDVFDTETGTVIDWKIVGNTAHRDYSANGPSEGYNIQAHCYGAGFAAQGYEVRRVAIAFLGRAKRLSDLHVWSEPFDPSIAARAVHRAGVVAELILGGARPLQLPATPGGACYFCLAAETEVVTRGGIRPIVELAGSKPELLIPQATAGAERGDFVSVPVRAMGQQRLYRVEMSRGRARKVVHATAEHRWITAGGDTRTTVDLSNGVRLATVRAESVDTEQDREAVARGFIFGDGSRPQGRRPGTLSVYDRSPKRPMLDYFPHLTRHRYEQARTGDMATWLYGIPRDWKELPELDQHSGAWWVSWLAGYFAADGSVSQSGQCTISSADRAALERVREVAALCGIRYGTIRSHFRVGFGTEATELFALDLNRRDVPAWFFLLDHHRARVTVRSSLVDRPLWWTVRSVKTTDRVETVYCATVPEVAAFALADGLTTGNCEFRGRPDAGYCDATKEETT